MRSPLGLKQSTQANSLSPSSRDLRQQVVAIHKSTQVDSSTAQSPESTAHTAQTSSTIQHSLAQETRSALSAKRKRFIPTPLPLAQKQTSDRFLFLQSRGEPRTPASSQKAAAGHYCPPLSRFLAPRSGREEVAPCGAIEKIHSAQAESNQINGACEARNLESVVGGLGAKGVKKEGGGGIRGATSQFKPPCPPLKRLYPKRH